MLALVLLLLGVVLAPPAVARADETAVVGATPRSAAAVAYVVSTVEGAREHGGPGRDRARLRRAAIGWGARRVVVVDVETGFVWAMRPSDGRVVERRMAPAVAGRSAYAVAVVAAELLEILDDDATPRRTHPARRPDPFGIVIHVGPSVAIALDGQVVSPRVAAEVGLRIQPVAWPIGIEVGVGAAPAFGIDHAVASPGGQGATVQYTRHDLTGTVGLWLARGRLALGAGGLVAVGLATARAFDGSGTLGEHSRVVASFGGFAAMRVRLGRGFFVGLGWALDVTPSHRRFLVRGSPALDEGQSRFAATLDVGWFSGDRLR